MLETTPVLLQAHLDVWREHHASYHASLGSTLFDQLSDEQLCTSPFPDMASVAWHLWHVARCEDVAINMLIGQRGAVYDEDGWHARIRAGRTDVGSAMAADDMASFNRSIDTVALRDYLRAVRQRTDEIIPTITPETWARKPEPDSVERALQNAVGDAFRERAAPYWRSVTNAWFLWWLVGEHHYLHYGEALVTRDVVLRQT